jgi:hypothetical protein
LDFNYDGSRILISGANSKPKVLTREGKEEIEFIKGDPYITD